MLSRLVAHLAMLGKGYGLAGQEAQIGTLDEKILIQYLLIAEPTYGNRVQHLF
jgi:hypothetical protein